MKNELISRRQVLQGAGALGLLTAVERLVPAYAQTSATSAAQPLPSLSGDTIDLTIAETPFRVGNHMATATTINGTVPGPILRLREGQEVTINVTNRLQETSSIHWHGVLQPRFEINIAAQRVERFGVGKGLNDIELGLRLRYAIRRKFAPYIGVSYQRSFFGTADLMRQDGKNPSQVRFVAGVRVWH